jgi:hypothetical protein
VPAELMALAAREFGIIIDHAARPTDARSGAGVHPARTPDDRSAYLKITPASLGVEALDGARRELRFYRQLATEVPVRTPPLLDALETDLGVALLLAAVGHQVNVGAWSAPAWSTLGQDLAGLHTVPVDGQDWSRSASRTSCGPRSATRGGNPRPVPVPRKAQLAGARVPPAH